MKLILIVLLSLLSYHCCTGYPAVDSEFSQNVLLENGTSIESGLDTSNETASNLTSPLDIHGVGPKGDEKDKESIKTFQGKVKDVYDKVKGNLKDKYDKVKDKAKDIYDKVKDKVKDKYDKVKDKIKDFKDKIGSKGGGGGSGGGSGGGYYRDKYDRDYDRDKYNRDYDRDKYNRDRYGRDSNYGGGGGSVDPKTANIAVGICIFIAVAGVIFVIVMKVREISQRDSS